VRALVERYLEIEAPSARGAEIATTVQVAAIYSVACAT